MPNLHLTTFVAAPVGRVFDLSRNLAVCKYVFHSRKEIFTSGAGSTLLVSGETATITAKHAGKTRSCMLRLTDLRKPLLFVEEQVKGDMQHFRHEHHFKEVNNGTIMIDMIEFGMPRDIIGKLLAKIYLAKYIEELVLKRHEAIKLYAETERWRAVQ
ncbi:MAG: cell division protein [Flavitalea sp.]